MLDMHLLIRFLLLPVTKVIGQGRLADCNYFC